MFVGTTNSGRICHVRAYTIETSVDNLNDRDTILGSSRANSFIPQARLTATRVLRASIRIVAGQASKEAVGCDLVGRSARIDPSVTDPSATDVTRRSSVYRADDDDSRRALRRFPVMIRRVDPAMTWLPCHLSVDKVK